MRRGLQLSMHRQSTYIILGTIMVAFSILTLVVGVWYPDEGDGTNNILLGIAAGTLIIGLGSWFIVYGTRATLTETTRKARFDRVYLIFVGSLFVGISAMLSGFHSVFGTLNPTMAAVEQLLALAFAILGAALLIGGVIRWIQVGDLRDPAPPMRQGDGSRVRQGDGSRVSTSHDTPSDSVRQQNRPPVSYPMNLTMSPAPQPQSANRARWRPGPIIAGVVVVVVALVAGVIVFLSDFDSDQAWMEFGLIGAGIGFIVAMVAVVAVLRQSRPPK